MNNNIISQICITHFAEHPWSIKRCSVGQGNYVYIVDYEKNKYVVRCSEEPHAYKDTIYWLERLSSIQVPVPKVVGKGKFEEYEYIILTYFEGEDIGLVYQQLQENEKKTIAKEVVQIQERVAALEIEDVEENWSWYAFVYDMLKRAKERIVQNGYFDAEKVDRLYKAVEHLDAYFSEVKPIAYLDDISSKNLLVHNGSLSGIIDIDWMGVGDKLTYVALTNMALLNMEYDTHYVQYILDEMQVTDMERKAFLFYTLMYCVDFMGERGMRFMDKTVEVNEEIIGRLNRIYDELWSEWVCNIATQNERVDA